MDAAHSISLGLLLALAGLAGAQVAPPPEPERPAAWRLADSASPYLRAHADNPVEWFPWGDEAFARARELDRPVFLSIGYSSCHWCHRMERDTFEDPRVAAALNGRFVCVKVDREERPDVDARYLNALVLMNGGGGWPATLFLLPDGRPFWGGTYLPPEGGPQGPGLLDVQQRLHELWTQQRGIVEQAAAELHAVLALDPLPPAAAAPDLAALLDAAATTLTGTLDSTWGGQHGAPKFPPALALSWLLQRHQRDGLSVGPLLELSLDAMSSAGLYDHVGGGFFRYCVDERWETPHFEKLLHDNALLAGLYAEAAVALDTPRWADVARETLAFVRRELRLPDGLYAGSLDADSLPAELVPRDAQAPPGEVAWAVPPGARGEEGRFYLWTPAELEAVLGDFHGPVFARLYGVTPEGSFLDAGQPTGRSLPRPGRTVPALAARPDPALAGGDEFVAWRTHVLERLRTACDLRPHPARDDKALAAANGLLLSTLARAGARLQDATLLAQAAELAQAVRARLVARDEPAPRVHHHLLDGAPAGRGDLLDTAAVARGLLDVHQAGGDPGALLDALALARALPARFGDPDGGFWDTERRDPRLPDRGRTPWDGALPAGSSVALELLLRLAPLDDTGALEDAAQRAIARLAPLAAASPEACPGLLAALDAATGPLPEVVLDGTGEPLAALQRAARAALPPAALLLPDAGALRAALQSERAAAQAAGREPLLAEDPALLAGRAAPAGEARAWVCLRRACLEPAATAAELHERLDALARGAPAPVAPPP